MKKYGEKILNRNKRKLIHIDETHIATSQQKINTFVTEEREAKNIMDHKHTHNS